MALAVSASAWSQGLDAHTFKTYGGTYMADCNNPAAPRATVFADALVIVNGNRRVAGSQVQPAYSYYGNSPPEGYSIALLATAPGGLDMVWTVFEDGSGRYLTIDVDPKLIAALGKPLAGKKFRLCGSAPRAATAPAPLTRSYALHELSAPGILMDPKARAAYYKALGALRREPWLADLDGPSPENKLVRVAGTEYILASACKNHDCFDNSTVLLYSAAQGVVHGKIYQRGKFTLIGAPPPAVAKALDRLWREQFRQNLR